MSNDAQEQPACRKCGAAVEQPQHRLCATCLAASANEGHAASRSLVTADRAPGNFGAFRDETLAGLQLARASAWSVVAFLARSMAEKADAPHSFADIAETAQLAATDRVNAAIALSAPDAGAHPHEYAPMLALRRLLDAADPAPGWCDTLPAGATDPERYVFEPVLADAMRAISALDRAPADPASARRRIEARLIAADGRAVPFEDLRRLTPNLAEADFRRLVAKLRDEGFATVSEADLSTYGKRRIQRFLVATDRLLFRASPA